MERNLSAIKLARSYPHRDLIGIEKGLFVCYATTSMLTYYLALTSMFILTWATMYPQDALSVIAELKRQQRLRVIHNAGAECAKELAQDLNEFADHMGIDQTLANEVLEQNHDMIVERLGSKYTDELLGEPDPNERYD